LQVFATGSGFLAKVVDMSSLLAFCKVLLCLLLVGVDVRTIISFAVGIVDCPPIYTENAGASMQDFCLRFKVLAS
jgi:hypothetical protein